jgi:hypothetical protein
MNLLPCQELFGIVRGDQVRALIETTTGQACPCVQGLGCPLVKSCDIDEKPHLAAV